MPEPLPEHQKTQLIVRSPLSTEGFVSATNLMGETLKVKGGGHGEAGIALAETGGPVYMRFTSR